MRNMLAHNFLRANLPWISNCPGRCSTEEHHPKHLRHHIRPWSMAAHPGGVPMIHNIIAFLQNLVPWRKPASTTVPIAPTTGGLGPAAAPSGPYQRQTFNYTINPMVNGTVTTRVREIGKQGGTASVETTETRVLTGNGTVVRVEDIKLICDICGLPSEESWYCQICSRPTCVPHLLCVKEPDTGEIHQLCPECCARFYQQWNTWRGQLSAPFSIRKIAKPGA